MAHAGKELRLALAADFSPLPRSLGLIQPSCGNDRLANDVREHRQMWSHSPLTPALVKDGEHTKGVFVIRAERYSNQDVEAEGIATSMLTQQVVVRTAGVRPIARIASSN